jgi:hypothetical protein
VFALRPALRYEYHHIALLSIKGGRLMKRSITRIAMMTAIAVAAADLTASASFAQGGPGYQQGPGYYVPPPRRDRDRDRDRDDRGDRSLGAKVAQGECKSGAESFIRVVGGARITQNGAKNSADSAWRSAVIAAFGEEWGTLALARTSGRSQFNPHEDYRCFQTRLSLWRCEAAAYPCRAQMQGR